MAIILELNLISVNFFDVVDIVQNINEYNLTFSADSISCMDNWMWENQKELKSNTDIETYLNKEKIIVIKLKSFKFDDMGIYIEKQNDEYYYNIWINTEGYPELDSDVINKNNTVFFKKLYNLLKKVLSEQNIQYKILAIGEESLFFYSENINDILIKSKNVISWIINRELENTFHIKEYLKNEYLEKEIQGLNALIFEKTA